MQQNIKVDVIYYLSPSDFEMEFNLCGCCHMRLLNEKTNDKKELVKALARAVSRSKIMILCGPLFDDNGLIKLVSTAIGKSTEVINNASYGINYDGSISVIEGSIPLVTPDGLFGGCIIESGPQAIILLSENKSIRKSIMNNLIHQYIYELSLLPEDALTRAEEQSEEPTKEQIEKQEEEVTKENTNSEETQQDNNVTEYEDISSVSQELEAADETEEVPCETQETEACEEINEKTEQSDAPADLEEQELQETEEKEELPQEIEMYIDPQQLSPKKMTDYAKSYVPSETDTLFIAEEDYEYEYDIDDEDENTQPLPKFNLSIIFIVIVLSLIVVVLLYLMVYIPYSKGINFTSYVEQIFGPASSI